MCEKTSMLILVTLLVGSVLIQPALGMEYPTKPIEIVVPFAPGQAMDLVSRVVAETAPKYLGQPIVVVNKPGAAGSLAAADVIASKPDGYKLNHASSGLFAITVKIQKVPFDPRDLTPLVTVSVQDEGLAVRSDSPWKTLNDLLEYGKKNPGKLKWAHGGRGTRENIVGLLLFKKAGAVTIDLPHSGGTPEKLVALLGGHVDAAFLSYGLIQDHVRAGKIRVLMSTIDKKFIGPPDAPSAIELGFPEVAKTMVFNGYFVHKDTPEDIKKILIDAFQKTFKDPEFKKGFEKTGQLGRFEGPEFFKESIKNLEETATPILKELGLYIER